MSAGVMRSRIAAASSAAVPGDLAAAEGAALVMPIVPSDAVIRTTTHFVTCLEIPALVKVPSRGIATPNTSTRSIFGIGIFLAGIQLLKPNRQAPKEDDTISNRRDAEEQKLITN